MTFEEILPKIAESEGAYVNDPDDPGGATKYGVTQNVFDAWRKHKGLDKKHVRHLDTTERDEIFHDNYWRDSHCEQLPAGIRYVHLDFAVNAGVDQAAKTMQRVLGVTADGIIGPKTLAAARDKPIIDFIREYSDARRVFYERLAETKKNLSKFLRGWIIRTRKVERISEAWVGNTASYSRQA